jgi:phosphoribosylformylglycinamidine cyclo-ligase
LGRWRDEERKLITDRKLENGDRIIMLKSTGINANGVSLARAVAEKMPNGYATKLPSGQYYGEATLNKTNIYANLIQDIFNAGINIHYVSNITGHGMRKVMRARGEFSYVLENIFDPPEVFHAIQQYAGLSEYQMYDTYNMGMDYALFISPRDVEDVLSIIRRNNFEGINAGYIEGGERKVVITPKDIIFNSESMDLR